MFNDNLNENIFDSKHLGLLFLMLPMFNILVQVYLLKIFDVRGLYVIIALNLALLSILVYIYIIKEFSVYLLILNLIQYLYLNNYFHYNFIFEIILSFTLFYFFFWGVLKYLLTSNVAIPFSYLNTPLIFFTLYTLIIAIYSLFIGNNKYWILVEIFHIAYLPFAIIISYLIREKRSYNYILYSLFAMGIIISLEYTYYNLVLGIPRFVTFQSGFLPLLLGFSISSGIFTKNKLFRKAFIFTTVIIFIGLASTLTRSLWLASIVTVIVLLLTYLIYKKQKLFASVLIIFTILSGYYILGQSTNQSSINFTSKDLNKIEYRTKSITNPLEDISFLMRVELGYYVFEKILESPIIGKGFGDSVKYKILVNSNVPNYYLDNSFLYITWKTGLVGLVLYLWIIYRILKISLYIFRHSPDSRIKSRMLGIFAGILGLLVLSLVSPILFKYKSNIIFAIMFAYTEFEFNKLNPLQKT